MGYENCGKHPNSLKALKPISGPNASERAREMQAKGVEARKRNKAAREAMKLTAKEFKEIQLEVIPGLPDALTLLKIQLAKAIVAEDDETIERLALALAEFEAPKLQRVDQTTLNVDKAEMSQEELEKRIAELQK